MSSTAGIHVDDSGTSLRLSWDNRNIPKKRFLGCVLIVFWLLWTPLTVFVTTRALAARGFEIVPFLIALVISWLIVFLIPYALLMRRWREAVIIDETSLTLTFSGPLARRSKTIPLSSIESISIGHVQDTDGRESIQTLNINLSRTEPFWSRRQMVAYWLGADQQDLLFRAIEAFVDLHDLKVPMTRLR